LSRKFEEIEVLVRTIEPWIRGTLQEASEGNLYIRSRGLQLHPSLFSFRNDIIVPPFVLLLVLVIDLSTVTVFD
jgi:hypothetical protein